MEGKFVRQLASHTTDTNKVLIVTSDHRLFEIHSGKLTECP